jgi:ubiquinone/menaquinone biosynthesis C-methylase UbiE
MATESEQCDPHDEFTLLVIKEFQRAAREKESYTVPWLNLDQEAYRAYREGLSQTLPDPLEIDPADLMMFEKVNGLDVLCLAGGGGQQSALFSLLGARVTVFDLMREQLAGDQTAADFYGYSIRTVQGDMRNLSLLADSSFDRVYQPISTLYTPDLPAVYAGVARVLRPGGLYYSDYTFPLLYMTRNTGWDGSAYTLRVSQPYRRGEILETPDGRASFSEGQPIGEYHHLLSDIINGLIQAGLAINGLWESPRPNPSTVEDIPGTENHLNRFIPFGISVVAQKSR